MLNNEKSFFFIFVFIVRRIPIYGYKDMRFYMELQNIEWIYRNIVSDMENEEVLNCGKTGE